MSAQSTRANAAVNIVFRADASAAIGAGHVMRCLALAGYLADRGARIRFLCAKYPGHLAAQIAAAGMEIALLPPEGALDEAAAAHALADIAPVNLLIVDHYGLDVRWERAMRPLAERIMVIDDLANRDHECDLLLDQNLREHVQERYAGRVPPGCRILLGPRHALLRREFMQPDLARTRDGAVKRVLISYGGSDPRNESGKALEAVASLGRRRPDVDLVLGSSNPNRKAVAARAYGMNGVRVHEQTNRMARLIGECDLALGGCGVNAWERCALGMPALVTVMADNQSESARVLHELGAVSCLGDASRVDVSALARALEWAIASPRDIAAMGRNAFAVTAGWERELLHLADELKVLAADNVGRGIVA
jgi:UDP-2,4-diacetamido-2,4,6-trideoxy-beta-L-altropyranose hydrolase